MSSVNENLTFYSQVKLTEDQFIWRFSPNRTDPTLLEAIFVGREPLLQNVLEKVAESATTGSTHHVLLYGPRGIGKSHFLSLLHHRLGADVSLHQKIHIACLNEEETTTSLVQLLVRIYRSLCDAYPNDFSSEWLDELLQESPKEISEVLTRRLVKRFENRTLVILIENLDLLFENLGTAGQHQLRTLLQEHPFACVIGTSQQLFHAVTDRSEPFFGFFQQIRLRPLSLQEAYELLVRISVIKGQDDLTMFLQTPDGRSRARVIHDLVGGNHRVYIVLSRFMTCESFDRLVIPFKKMADDLTPYYQERLRWISPQQRQIVELLCRERSTINPKMMARRLLASEQTIGKQVRKLVEIGYLTATQRGRETFYELSEPLMRLAFEVKEQSLLLMLADFLRSWYQSDSLLKGQTSPLLNDDQKNLSPKSPEAFFAMNMWAEGFELIRTALFKGGNPLKNTGDVATILSLIFQLSHDEQTLQLRIDTLVSLCQQSANLQGTNTAENPLLWLGAGLVRSLAKINANRVTPQVMESYSQAFQQRCNRLPEFDIPLRLFRCGIRFLITRDPAVFVELIRPERNILRQAVGLEDKN